MQTPPLVTAAQMAALDQDAIEGYGLPARLLMETAGRAVARVCAGHFGRRARVAVACGSGNNGGDGLVAARALAAWGHDVQVFLLAEPARMAAAASQALGSLRVTGGARLLCGKSAATLGPLQAAEVDVWIDALLGTGLSRNVEGLLADAIDALNVHAAPKLSVDIPSGVHSDSGEVMGRSVAACVTVALGCRKLGHYLHPGRSLRGKLYTADIGLSLRHLPNLDDAQIVQLLRRHDGTALLPRRAANSHKGQFGHVVVLAGSPRTPGAAHLTLHGALRSGAGLVSFAAQPEALTRPGTRDEVMLRTLGTNVHDNVETCLEGASALVIGPGLGQATRERDLLAALLQRATVPVCLDADALNLLAQNSDMWRQARSSWVLTPHPKEMARLLGDGWNAARVQADRVVAAKTLAQRHGCHVVLKGDGTLIAEPSGKLWLVGEGTPALAVGGTGDVLAGLIGGLVAQRLRTVQAIQLGVLAHACAGRVAARQHGEAGVLAHDVAASLGVVWRAWRR